MWYCEKVFLLKGNLVNLMQNIFLFLFYLMVSNLEDVTTFEKLSLSDTSLSPRPFFLHTVYQRVESKLCSNFPPQKRTCSEKYAKQNYGVSNCLYRTRIYAHGI